eukprot:45982-Eustigmatos_ZCMA.PRE.1
MWLVQADALNKPLAALPPSYGIAVRVTLAQQVQCGPLRAVLAHVRTSRHHVAVVRPRRARVHAQG